MSVTLTAVGSDEAQGLARSHHASRTDTCKGRDARVPFGKQHVHGVAHPFPLTPNTEWCQSTLHGRTHRRAACSLVFPSDGSLSYLYSAARPLAYAPRAPARRLTYENRRIVAR